MNPANILAKAKNFAKPSETDHMDPGRDFFKKGNQSRDTGP